MNLYDKHLPLLDRAAQACRERGFFSPYPETPAKYPGGETARAAGEAAFRAHLGSEFALDQPGTRDGVGEEVSPYTREPLGIRYPRADVDALFAAAKSALPGWAAASPEARIGVLMEALDGLYRRLFEIAYAVMHTAGQSFAMSYAGSGTNALDRGIEALVYAREAMAAVPRRARWEREFGSVTIRLDKTYRLVPRGVAVCFSCASFPTWNAWTSMLASLATGNAVIVKPHPATVLPMAITVRVFRETLAAAGFMSDLVTLALDTFSEPVGKILVKHPDTAIVDFTGSSRFGQWVEQNGHPALVYTETAGVNTVVLESAESLEAMAKSLGTTLCMFSAQMCTSPQNIFIPKGGIRAGGRQVPYEDVVQAIAGAVRSVAAEPKRAAMILATLQSPQTEALIDQLAAEGAKRGRVLVESKPYAHPEFPDARTRTPLMIEAPPEAADLYGEERFGPISFVIPVDSAEEGLARATADVKRVGGLTAFVYSTDEAFLARAEDAYAQAGAQLTCNLTGPMPLNFAAAYSDYHVTGLNPAGNASLTDASFVASRFRIVQSRRPAG